LKVTFPAIFTRPNSYSRACMPHTHTHTHTHTYRLFCIVFWNETSVVRVVLESFGAGQTASTSLSPLLPLNPAYLTPVRRRSHIPLLYFTTTIQDPVILIILLYVLYCTLSYTYLLHYCNAAATIANRPFNNTQYPKLQL